MTRNEFPEATNGDPDETPQSRKERLLFYVFLTALLVTMLSGNFKTFQKRATVHEFLPECSVSEKEKRVICHFRKRVVPREEVPTLIIDAWTHLDQALDRFLHGRLAANGVENAAAVRAMAALPSPLHPAIARLQTQLRAPLTAVKGSFAALADAAQAATARVVRRAGSVATAIRRRATRLAAKLSTDDTASASPAPPTAQAFRRPGSTLMDALRGRRGLPRLGAGDAW